MKDSRCGGTATAGGVREIRTAATSGAQDGVTSATSDVWCAICTAATSVRLALLRWARNLSGRGIPFCTQLRPQRPRSAPEGYVRPTQFGVTVAVVRARNSRRRILEEVTEVFDALAVDAIAIRPRITLPILAIEKFAADRRRGAGPLPTSLRRDRLIRGALAPRS